MHFNNLVCVSAIQNIVYFKTKLEWLIKMHIKEYYRIFNWKPFVKAVYGVSVTYAKTLHIWNICQFMTIPTALVPMHQASPCGPSVSPSGRLVLY